MSRDLGRDVPDLEKLYARELWADFSLPTEYSLDAPVLACMAGGAHRPRRFCHGCVLRPQRAYLGICVDGQPSESQASKPEPFGKTSAKIARRDYHQGFAQPDFRAEKKGTLSGGFSAYFPVFKAEKGQKKICAKPWLPVIRA